MYWAICKSEDGFSGFFAPFVSIFLTGWWCFSGTSASQTAWSTFGAQTTSTNGMGGGTSVAAHRKGLLVDGNNGLDGDGPFSTDRTGELPVGALIDLCYSGKYTHAEMRRKIKGQGGMMSYVQDTDVKTIEEKALAGDEKYKNSLDAMI